VIAECRELLAPRRFSVVVLCCAWGAFVAALLRARAASRLGLHAQVRRSAVARVCVQVVRAIRTLAFPRGAPALRARNAAEPLSAPAEPAVNSTVCSVSYI